MTLTGTRLGPADAGTWNAEDTVLFGPTADGVLARVSAAGGTPAAVTTLDHAPGEQAHKHPWFLPDGRRFLYFASPTNRILVGSLDDPTLRVNLVASDSKAVFASGELLFVRNGVLLGSRV